MCAKLNRTGDLMLIIKTDYREGIMFVRLKGELTKDSIIKLDKKVTKRVKSLSIHNLVLNVSNLKDIDYKGINRLFYNYEMIKENNGSIMLCGNNINIDKRLKKSRLLKYIKEISDELCAMKILNER